MRDSMFTFLRSINLSPLEWTKAIQLTGQGSPYIGDVLDAAFSHAVAVVVLMTPDEVAYLRSEYADGETDPQTKPAAQARPNVLFEAGMALGRDAYRTVLVEIGEVRPFSDVGGRHAVRLDNEVASRQELANRLATAGCAIDLTGTDWHSSGDFTAPQPPGRGAPLGRRIPSATTRPPIDFDLKYFPKGSNGVGKLQVANRGYETAFNVRVNIPPEAAISLDSPDVAIKKIPGHGKAVTIDVMNLNAGFGSRADEAFDIEISATTESGEDFHQEVFVDVNG